MTLAFTTLPGLSCPYMRKATERSDIYWTLSSITCCGQPGCNQQSPCRHCAGSLGHFSRLCARIMTDPLLTCQKYTRLHNPSRVHRRYELTCSICLLSTACIQSPALTVTASPSVLSCNPWIYLVFCPLLPVHDCCYDENVE